eukprot:12933509-Prorocentrum_lima.AAC.1
MLAAALSTTYIEEKDGLMHLSEVRKLSVCNIKTRNPDRTTLCSSKQKSLDKINTEFPALVLDRNIKQ